MNKLRSLQCKKCKSSYLEDQGWPLQTCPSCRVKDIRQQYYIVKHALHRRTDVSAPRNLTLDEWMQTLEYFHGRCAYCLTKSYECLEHFIPIKLGGGTCMSNVIPSCLSCNKLKDATHPALVISISQQDIERVRQYLLSLLLSKKTMSFHEFSENSSQNG